MQNRNLRGACWAFTLCIASACAFAQTPSTKDNGNSFVIRNARIFDGSQVIERGDVLVQNGTIKAVGANISVPSGTRVVDGTGKTLLPGLIDSHVHTMGMDTSLKSALALGVTTEFDMGAAPKYAFQIKKEQAEGKLLDMADLRASEIHPTAPNGHGTEYDIPVRTISSPAEAQDLVDAGIAEGDDFIGEIIYEDGSEYGLRVPTLSKETLQAVIEAAHRRGKLAVVHVLSLQGAKDAVAAGADGLAHLFADNPPDDEFISLVAQHHAFVIPTLSVLASAAGVPNGPSLALDPRLAPYLTPEAIADLRGKFPRNAGSLSNSNEAIRRLSAAGVPILAGTDAHNLGTAHGASLLGELELLVNAGLTPAQALASATSVNAAAFQLDDRGQIVPGKRADLLLVDGDPTAQISDIKNIVSVWKLGVQMDREAYRAELDCDKEAQQALRHAPAPAGSDPGLISDFEDGHTSVRFGFGWIPSSGRLLGGEKPDVKIGVIDGGAQGSAKSLQITGQIADGIFGWAGAMFVPGPKPMAQANLSGKKAITFWTKGDGKPYQVMVFTKAKDSVPVSRAFRAGPEWTRITLPFSDFDTDGSDLQALMFAEVGVPGSFSFAIDDVQLEAADEPADTIGSPGAAPATSGVPTEGGTETRTSAVVPVDAPPASRPVKPAPGSDGGWTVLSTSYMWLQGVHGDLSALGKDLSFSASPTHLAEHANMGMQQLVGAQYNRLLLVSDLLWTPITFKNASIAALPLPPGISVKLKFTPVIYTPEIGYRFIDRPRIKIDGLTGARFWHLGATATLTPSPIGHDIYKSTNWADPLLGARIQVPLSRKTTATIWGDAGGWGAGSQLEYEIIGALSYRIKPRWAVDAAWRYLYSDYSQDLFESRIVQSGLLIGVTYTIKSGRHLKSLE